jgi:hypothetical protein
MPPDLHPDDISSSATPLIISESETHVVVAVEIAKTTLVGYRRLSSSRPPIEGRRRDDENHGRPSAR